MKKILTNYRYYILAALFIIAVLGFIAVPNDGLPAFAWLAWAVIPRVICLVAGWATIKLGRYWYKRGEIPEILDIL